MRKTVFIGSGNMARAIIGGMVGAGTKPDSIFVVNPANPISTAEVQNLYGAVPAGPEALRDADAVVLAVKPQAFPDAAQDYKSFMNPSALIISIMAGVKTQTVEATFGGARVVRVMPNLALAVGCGASGCAPGRTATENDLLVTREIFSAAGIAVRVPEEQIDDVAALSGSGAAYLYYMLESLRDAAVEDGMEPDIAAVLAKQTLLGAAKLMEREAVPPEELRRRITSEKGTTEAAIHKMGELGLPEAVKAGYRANKARSAELAGEKS